MTTTKTFTVSISRVALGWLGLGLGSSCSTPPVEILNGTSGGAVDVPAWTCVPGEAQACPCTEALEGQRVCLADGSAWGACDCSPGAVSQAAPPTSTGDASLTGAADSTSARPSETSETGGMATSSGTSTSRGSTGSSDGE